MTPLTRHWPVGPASFSQTDRGNVERRHPTPKSNPNRIPNRNPNLTVSLTLSQTSAKPDAHAKNYLAIVRNYYSTKTADLHAKHKYTTKGNLCIRVQTSDPSVFRYNVI